MIFTVPHYLQDNRTTYFLLLHCFIVIKLFLQTDSFDRLTIGILNLLVFFLKKWANPGIFCIYFCLFKTHIIIFTTNKCEECPSSIWCRDSNSRPLYHESPSITTRPGLPPFVRVLRCSTRPNERSPWFGHFQLMLPSRSSFIYKSRTLV